MEVHLHQESVVNERTGVVEAPSEYVENLRALERSVQRYDNDIDSTKETLKELRALREKAVAQCCRCLRPRTKTRPTPKARKRAIRTQRKSRLL